MSCVPGPGQPDRRAHRLQRRLCLPDGDRAGSAVVCRAPIGRQGPDRLDGLSRARSSSSRCRRRSSAATRRGRTTAGAWPRSWIAAGIPLVAMDALMINTLPVRRRAVQQRGDRSRHGAGAADAVRGGRWIRPALRCCARRPSTNSPACRWGSWTRPSSRRQGRARDAAGLPRLVEAVRPDRFARPAGRHRQQHGEARTDRRRIRRATPRVRRGRRLFPEAIRRSTRCAT